ncbi:MAG: hypothetical protein HFG75_00155 [Hungatella sp.]|nr:hypothetical protein [Hungatella sp.]
MTKTEILFNYKQAIRQAEKLESIGRKLEQLAKDRLADTIGQLKSVWQSDSSPEYYSKAGKVQEEIGTTAASVKKIAQAIRTTAEAVKEAELRALEIAESRTYQ